MPFAKDEDMIQIGRGRGDRALHEREIDGELQLDDGRRLTAARGVAA